MVVSVAVEPRSLYRRGEPIHCRVDFRGRAEYSQVRQTSLVSKKQVKRWEAGLNGQNVSRDAGKTICEPPLGFVPEV